ncbi:MAG TPA: LacI family DNA-binding transcriptional regulator [Actinocrinis sp.]|uniref:LacI family DNA-binding transcriptional regulator n=1 Tax=Actinocrinis sp. TaxID=1920516 RepID=UPI002DDDAB04|nr:LacI family DNA-binding transcriptional regulator [Actinocrinis sp.]HEV2347771.1 LacI family DNA-binding transcriptional regulator [Actinocrinis sp.]
MPQQTDTAPAAVANRANRLDKIQFGKPTLADVAALAGVSEATASRVLNGSARVSLGARSHVEDAMARLGYVRWRAPRAQTSRSGSVAAIVTESSARFFSDPFFARLLWGASRTLSAAGLQLAFLVVHDQNEYAAAERYIRRGSADGVMLISAHGRDPLLLTLQAAGIPTVVCGRPLVPVGALYVDADNAGGARTAVGHLLRSGRRRVVTIAGPRDMAVGIDRLAGYRDMLEAAGLPALIGYGDFSQASGEHAMTRLLERRPDLDAVFAASDLMAAGALRALRRAGRRVPEDVAVVGFDDDPIAQHTMPPLTTVRQPVEEQGAVMARHVMALIEHESISEAHDNLPTSLVQRESA